MLNFPQSTQALMIKQNKIQSDKNARIKTGCSWNSSRGSNQAPGFWCNLQEPRTLECIIKARRWDLLWTVSPEMHMSKSSSPM